MLRTDGPDWQRVLSYVESIYRHFEMWRLDESGRENEPSLKGNRSGLHRQGNSLGGGDLDEYLFYPCAFPPLFKRTLEEATFNTVTQKVFSDEVIIARHCKLFSGGQQMCCITGRPPALFLTAKIEWTFQTGVAKMAFQFAAVDWGVLSVAICHRDKVQRN